MKKINLFLALVITFVTLNILIFPSEANEGKSNATIKVIIQDSSKEKDESSQSNSSESKQTTSSTNRKKILPQTNDFYSLSTSIFGGFICLITSLFYLKNKKANT